MLFWCKKFKMAAKIMIKTPNHAISPEISQSQFLAITSDNIITVLNNKVALFYLFLLNNG